MTELKAAITDGTRGGGGIRGGIAGIENVGHFGCRGWRHVGSPEEMDVQGCISREVRMRDRDGRIWKLRRREYGGGKDEEEGY